MSIVRSRTSASVSEMNTVITAPPRKVELEYRHIKAISLFQEVFRLKRSTVHRLNQDLEIIYNTLISVTNNISNNYMTQVITQESYQKYMTQADKLLTSFGNIPRPMTLTDLCRNSSIRYTIAYLTYQTVELVKLCGASSCNDIFRILSGKDWDLAISRQYTKLLNLYNTMFVPIGVKIGNTDSELKVQKYSAFTASVLLKVHGAEITVPFFDRVLIIRGYFRDDPLNIARSGGTLEKKYLDVVEAANAKFGSNPQLLARYIEQISLRDFLCNDIPAILSLISTDLDDLATMRSKPIGHVVEDFLKAKLKRQFNMITLLLLDDSSHEHVKTIIGTMLAQNSEQLNIVYRIMHWSVQCLFDQVSKKVDKSTDIGMDESVLPYETRIDNMKCSEAIRKKAREKLKEIKLSRDGNDKATKYLDGLLQVPFGVYRKEKILRFLGEFRERLDYTETALKEYLDCRRSQDEDDDPSYTDAIVQSVYNKIKGEHETENQINGVMQALEKDCSKLSNAHGDSSDYIGDFLIDYERLHSSWEGFKVDRRSYLDHVGKVLTNCIYGQDDAKRAIESLAAQWINGEMSGVVLGFQGYPGTGKTTLAKQGISRCLIDENGESRPFYFIPLGGSTGGNTLEGHGYTFVGSHWGKLVDCLREARVMNPILYFDELDKVSDTPKGEEIIRILTHLTDPEQNDKITDRYFDVDFDFSKALIIFSYNSSEKIDRILLDRIYEVQFRQYNAKEKVVIARDYVLPKILKSAGYRPDALTFTDEILQYIIENYTIEAGVRDMKDKLTELVRELNLRRIYDEQKYVLPYAVHADTVDDILKRRHKIKCEQILKTPRVGWVNGLYATSMGTGGITVIQIFNTPADQKYSLELTGKLGDVMKESVRCARTIGWRIFNKEDRQLVTQEWSDNALHIHFPEAGTAKDGPSAGAAITTAIISYFSKLPVRNYVAMTGEIDLYGAVRAIGGLQCKIEGAQRAGVKLVLIPKDNEHQYLEFKDDYHVKVVAVENISQIIRTCLIGAEARDFQYPHDISGDSTVQTILQYVKEIDEGIALGDAAGGAGGAH